MTSTPKRPDETNPWLHYGAAVLAMVNGVLLIGLGWWAWRAGK